MNISVITPYIGEAFGLERALRDSCQALRKAGHRVFVLTAEVRGEAPKTDGLKILPSLPQFRIFTPANAVKHLVDNVIKELESAEAEVVVLAEQFHPALIEAIAARWPTIYTAHSVSLTCPSSLRIRGETKICQEKSGWKCLLNDRREPCLPFRGNLRKTHAVAQFNYSRRGLQRVHRIMAVSESLKRTLVSDGWDASQIDVVYNIVDEPGTVVPFSPVPENLLVSASRLVLTKGLTHLLDALALIRNENVSLWMMGTGDQESLLKAQVEKLGLSNQVRFLGYRNYQETQRIVAAAKLYVQPNVGPEAFGLGMAEAMALGVPVIASDVPALNELVTHGQSGILVPPADASALSAAIKDLLQNPAKRTFLSQNGKTAMKRFSPRHHVEAFQSCLENAMQNFHAATPLKKSA